MNTIAPAKPVSHSSAPRSRSIERSRGGARVVAAWRAIVIASAHSRASGPVPFPPPLAGEGRGWLPAFAGPSGTNSVCIFRFRQREGRHRQDVKVEQHRPVLDVIEVVL